MHWERVILFSVAICLFLLLLTEHLITTVMQLTVVKEEGYRTSDHHCHAANSSEGGGIQNI